MTDKGLIPSALGTSVLAAPFVRLCWVSHKQMQSLIEQSRVAWALSALWCTVLAPVRSGLASWSWLHAGLKGLHVLVTALILILAAFATTDQIALAVLAAFALLVLRGATSSIPFRFTIIDGLVGLFFLTALIATLFSSYIQTSLVGLAKFMVFLAGYINFRVLIGENRLNLFWLCGLLLLLGFAESLVGFYQYVNHVQPLATWQDPNLNPEERLTRVFGTLKPYNPNLLAGFLIPCAAAGVGLTLKNLVKGRWWMAVPQFLLTLSVFAGLVLTGSRGGYLAIMAMAVTTFLYLGHLLWHEPGLKERYRLKALWILVLVGSVVAAVGATVVIPALQTRFLSIFAMREDSSNSYRMNVWISTFQMIRDNWWVGIGPGNDTFKQVYGLYMIPGYNALSAYSIFLEIWVEQGILGIISFLLLCLVAMLRSVIAFYAALPTSHKVVIGFLLTGIIGSVVYGLFDTIWYRPSVNLLFWLLVSGLAVYSEDAIVEHPDHA